MKRERKEKEKYQKKILRIFHTLNKMFCREFSAASFHREFGKIFTYLVLLDILFVTSLREFNRRARSYHSHKTEERIY